MSYHLTSTQIQRGPISKPMPGICINDPLQVVFGMGSNPSFHIQSSPNPNQLDMGFFFRFIDPALGFDRQWKIANALVANIEADPVIAGYFLHVLNQYSGFKIEGHKEKLPSASFVPSTVCLIIAPHIINAPDKYLMGLLRHEMRHAFWSRVHTLEGQPSLVGKIKSLFRSYPQSPYLGDWDQQAMLAESINNGVLLAEAILYQLPSRKSPVNSKQTVQKSIDKINLNIKQNEKKYLEAGFFISPFYELPESPENPGFVEYTLQRYDGASITVNYVEKNVYRHDISARGVAEIILTIKYALLVKYPPTSILLEMEAFLFQMLPPDIIRFFFPTLMKHTEQYVQQYVPYIVPSTISAFHQFGLFFKPDELFHPDVYGRIYVSQENLFDSIDLIAHNVGYFEYALGTPIYSRDILNNCLKFLGGKHHGRDDVMKEKIHLYNGIIHYYLKNYEEAVSHFKKIYSDAHKKKEVIDVIFCAQYVYSLLKLASYNKNRSPNLAEARTLYHTLLMYMSQGRSSSEVLNDLDVNTIHNITVFLFKIREIFNSIQPGYIKE